MSVAGGVDEQFPVGMDEHDPMVLPLDEQDPIDRAGWGWMNRTRGGQDEQDHLVEGRMNSRRWRLDEQ